MSTKPSSSDVSVANFHPGSTSDEGLIRGFLLSLGASGRSEKTRIKPSSGTPGGQFGSVFAVAKPGRGGFETRPLVVAQALST